MSHYANTVLPTLEDVFADIEPPIDAVLAAMAINMAGYPDVADIVRGMTPAAYEAAVWDAHLRSIEVDRPRAFVDDDEDTDSYDERYDNK